MIPSIYLILKALHIVAVVAWFAGLLYLPRLFVYHNAASEESVRQTLRRMANRLYKIIMNPSVALVFITGFAVLWSNPSVFLQTWFHFKFVLVLLLLGYHILCGRFVRLLATDKKSKSTTFYRWFNEIPTVFLVFIVILAVVKPF